jgi:hypothetical protein
MSEWGDFGQIGSRSITRHEANKSNRQGNHQLNGEHSRGVAFHLGIRPKQAREMITYHQKRAGEDRAPPDDGEKAAGRGRALLPASRRRAPAPARSTTTEGGAGSGGPVGAW